MLKLTFIGHACFLLDDGKYRVVIDPFIANNPAAKVGVNDLKVDYILLTHGHGDHLGDAIEIARKNEATIVSNFELSLYCSSKGVKKTMGPHIGGVATLPFGSVKLTIAHHGSTLGNDPGYGGAPVGFVVRMGGKVVYHSGDTGLFMDMKLIGELDKLDAAMLPIGGFFTMDAKDAAKAVEILRPKVAIPMHYSTFDLIKADPEEFARLIKPLGSECVILKPGESYTLA